MARTTNTSYVFAKRPTGDIIPGETFNAVTSPAPTAADLQDGEVLYESHYLSLDPSMRVWLNGQSAEIPADPVASLTSSREGLIPPTSADRRDDARRQRW